MPPLLSPTETLAYSTVRIAVKLQCGSEATGTGFFFSFCRTEATHIPVIVTNKHVVEGAISGGFNLTLSSASGGPSSGHQQIILTDFPHLWIPHPDPNVDLTVMQLGPILSQTQLQGFEFFFEPLCKDMIATSSDLAELSPAEDLLMVGYTSRGKE